jgi:hypothetical protein
MLCNWLNLFLNNMQYALLTFMVKLCIIHFVLGGRTSFSTMTTSLKGKSAQVIHTANMIYNGQSSKGGPCRDNCFLGYVPCSVVGVY